MLKGGKGGRRELHVFVHADDALLTLLTQLLTQGRAIMGALEDLETQVAANTDAETSAAILLQKLHDMLVAAGTDPTRLAAVRDLLKNSGDALAAAVVQNTPAEDGGGGGTP